MEQTGAQGTALAAGAATSSRGKCSRSSTQPLGLLDLPDDLLERILALLPQWVLMPSIPLVCKRLDAVQKASLTLWSHVQLWLTGDVAEAHMQCMVTWVKRRQLSIQDLELGCYYDQDSKLEQVASVLSMLGPRLKRLGLDFTSIGGGAVSRLQPLVERMTQLESLSIGFYDPQKQELPLLPRLHRLTALTALGWRGSDLRPPPGLADLTGLTSLSLHEPAMELWTPAISRMRLESFKLRCWRAPHLGFLAEQTSLRCLDLAYTSLQCWPAQLRLPLLTSLLLDGNKLSAAGALDGLMLLTALRELMLNDCDLRSLPTSLAALTGLQHLDLLRNRCLKVDSDCLGTLAQLSNLCRLRMQQEVARKVPAAEWIKLARVCPVLELELIEEYLSPSVTDDDISEIVTDDDDLWGP